MSNWVRLGPVEAFAEQGAYEVVAEGRVFALFHVGDGFYALDGMCPHQGGPLGQGRVEGHVVTCPWHGWQYDVRSGQHQSIPSLVHRAFPVKLESGEIFLDVDA